MARKKQKLQKDRGGIAIIVDGEDEEWYINKVKECYPCEKLKQIKVKPELPTKKNVQEQFNFAQKLLGEEYSFVILILDLDKILKEKKDGGKGVKEFEYFANSYNNYINIKAGQGSRANKWMNNLLVIVNNPCIEYWFLLHYKQTTKFYEDGDSLISELKRIPELKDYDKNETYIKSLYKKLESRLPNARKNTKEFCLQECENEGCSEMNKMFDYFDELDYNIK